MSPPKLGILRTVCEGDYRTPSGATTKLPVNCATSDTSGWPWKYFWTKTIGSFNPQLQNGTNGGGAGFSVEGECSSGQTVVRGMFAYIADKPFNVYVTCEADADEHNGKDNFTLIAKLYEIDGGEVSTIINLNTEERMQSSPFTCPATACPKVLWVGAASQPTQKPPDTGGGTVIEPDPLPKTRAYVSCDILG